MKLSLKLIKTDEKLSPRIDEGTDTETVNAYAECFDQLPPIVVFKVPDQIHYLLADGWHRYHAAKKLGLEEMEVEARAGSYNDAKEFALLSNLKHGRPLTRKEKRHVIAEFLKLHPERANNWIGQDLGVDDKTVEVIRGELENNTTSEFPKLEKLIGKDGKSRKRKIDKAPPSEEQPDEAKEPESPEEPEPAPPPIPTLGKYQLNAIHQADCVEALLGLPEESIDLFFADPPYNIGVRYGETNPDKEPNEQYFAWCSQWFMGIYRALKPGGALYLMHYPEVAARWVQMLPMFTFQRWLSWVYNSNVGHSSNNWSRSHRTILYLIKGTSPSFFDGKADPQPYKNPDDIRIKHLPDEGTTPYDWWSYNLVKNVSKDKTSWPNQLPLDLVKRVVLTSCPKEGVVCDPFMGSGTTAVAAIEAERDWLGFDQEKKACETTQKRTAKKQDERTA